MDGIQVFRVNGARSVDGDTRRLPSHLDQANSTGIHHFSSNDLEKAMGVVGSRRGNVD